VSELEAGIVAGDPERLTEFYERALGFALTTRLEFEGVGVVRKLRRGAARIKVFAPEPAATERSDAEPWYSSAGWRYAALYVESVETLHEIVAAVDAHGGTVLLAPSSHRADAVAAVVRDPEGNVWELLWESAGAGTGEE
jgi:catechol 2,3-dioxygenase-like lactoylglutathione lyase family enzyme